MVLLGKKRQSLPAAGQGWRQLHHGGSLQPPCGCSLPAQPASRLAPLITAHTRHVPVASAEAATCWCVIRPCLRAGGSSDLAPLLLWSCVKHSSFKRGVSKLPGLQGKEHAAIRQSTWQTRPGRSYLPPQSLGLFSSGGRSNLDAPKVFFFPRAMAFWVFFPRRMQHPAALGWKHHHSGAGINPGLGLLPPRPQAQQEVPGVSSPPSVPRMLGTAKPPSSPCSDRATGHEGLALSSNPLGKAKTPGETLLASPTPPPLHPKHHHPLFLRHGRAARQPLGGLASSLTESHGYPRGTCARRRRHKPPVAADRLRPASAWCSPRADAHAPTHARVPCS